MRSWLAMCLAIGCGAAPHAHPIENVAQAHPFDQADLAVFEDGEITLYQVGTDRVTKLATFHVGAAGPEPIAVRGAVFGWADHDHLFASLDSRVVMITARGMTQVALPDAAALQGPKPPGDGLEPAEGEGSLVVADGSAWWSRCTWGVPADGFQCTSYVSVQLWPSHERVVDGSAVQVAPAGWADAVPAGYRVTAADKVAACTAPGGAIVELRSTDDNDLALETHWVSAAPPRLLVIYGQYGFADAIPTRWTLHAGCTALPIARGDRTLLGPAGLWLATEDVGVHVWRGAKRIGDLPSASVQFRPR